MLTNTSFFRSSDACKQIRPATKSDWSANSLSLILGTSEFLRSKSDCCSTGHCFWCFQRRRDTNHTWQFGHGEKSSTLHDFPGLTRLCGTNIPSFFLRVSIFNWWFPRFLSSEISLILTVCLLGYFESITTSSSMLWTSKRCLAKLLKFGFKHFHQLGDSCDSCDLATAAASTTIEGVLPR